MRVALYNVQPKKRVNKDCMGGFGLGSMHTGLFGKLVGIAKKKGVYIPDLDLGYVGAIHRELGDDVEYTETADKNYDKVYIHASLQGHTVEIEEGKRLQKSGADVCYIGPMTRFLPSRFEGFSIIPDPVPMDLFPAWELFPMEKFSYFPSLRAKPIVPMLTATGCKYKCSYCPYRAYYGEWNPRPVESVCDEIRHWRASGVKGFIFRDPLFTADRERTIRICDTLGELVVGRHNCHRPYFEWACETRLENIDRDLIDKMAYSGCKAIHFGIESESNEVLKNVNRSNPSFEKQKELIDCCDQNGIRVNCFFILGLPGETKETAEDTVKKAIELNPNVAEFFVAQPYPGTKFFGQTECYELPYESYDGFTELFKHPNFKQGELSKLCAKAYKRYYFRPKYILSFIRRML